MISSRILSCEVPRGPPPSVAKQYRAKLWSYNEYTKALRIPRLSIERPLPSPEDRLVPNIEFEVGWNQWAPHFATDQPHQNCDVQKGGPFGVLVTAYGSLLGSETCHLAVVAVC
jgi:hypothetical protein